MKSRTISIFLIIGLIVVASSFLGQAKSRSAKVAEVEHTILQQTHRSPSISKGNHIDVAATLFTTDGVTQRIKALYILEDIEVLDVRLSPNKNPTNEEKVDTYLVLKLTKPESIVLNYFKERTKIFDVDRRKVGDHEKIGWIGFRPERVTTRPEHKILDKWLGTWRTTYKQSKTDLGTGTAKVIASRIVSDEFVQENVEHADKTSVGFLFTYDDQKKCYRRWQYSSARKTTEFTGKWDTDKKTMTWTSVGEASPATTTTHRFVDDDNIEWDVVTRNSTGKVLWHVEGKSVRIKETK